MNNISGCWCNNHLEKYDFVSWDDDYSQYIYIYMENIFHIFQTTNQSTSYKIITLTIRYILDTPNSSPN